MNDEKFKIKLDSVPELGILRSALRRKGYKTIDDLRMRGTAQLIRDGFVGEKLNRIIHTLEMYGIDTIKLFYGKEILDERKINILNMPLTRVIDDKKALHVLFSNDVYRIRDVIGMPIRSLAQLFFKNSDTDAYKTATIILYSIQEKFGVHVDDKNNILFHPKALEEVPMMTSDEILVFDLDLNSRVKRGLVISLLAFLFVAFSACAEEDEQDLNRVGMKFDMYEALYDGFISSAGSFLTEAEKEMLPFSAKLITLEIGLRFLSDFIMGDVYFKTRRSNQNLDRCRNQFKLVESIEAQMNKMQALL